MHSKNVISADCTYISLGGKFHDDFESRLKFDFTDADRSNAELHKVSFIKNSPAPQFQKYDPTGSMPVDYLKSSNIMPDQSALDIYMLNKTDTALAPPPIVKKDPVVFLKYINININCVN